MKYKNRPTPPLSSNLFASLDEKESCWTIKDCIKPYYLMIKRLGVLTFWHHNILIP